MLICYQKWTDASEESQIRSTYFGIDGHIFFNRELLVELMSNPDTTLKRKLFLQVSRRQKILTSIRRILTDIGNIDLFFEANLGLTDEIPKV
jgi:glucose-1-phosphate adenylyltransferase